MNYEIETQCCEFYFEDGGILTVGRPVYIEALV